MIRKKFIINDDLRSDIMKLKHKLFLSIIIIGFLVITVGLISFDTYTKNETVNLEIKNNAKNVEYISKTVENNLVELIRLTNTLTSNDTIKDALISSNNDFASLSLNDREQTINDLNTLWMNTDDINDPFIQARMDNDVAAFLISQQEEYPDLYGEIFLTNKYGVMISTTGKLTTLAHAQKYWWQGAYDGGEGIVYLDDRGYDDSVEGYVLGIVVPIYGDDGEIIGILKSNFNIANIFEGSVASFDALNQTGDYYVVRTKGLIVNGNEITPLTESINESVIPYLSSGKVESKELKIDNNDQFLAIAPIEITFNSSTVLFGGSYESIDHTAGNLGEGWSIVYLADKAAVLSETNNNLARLIIISFSLLLVIGIAALFIGQLLSKPFILLNDYINEVASGKLLKKDLKISSDEVGELMVSFNKMIDNLQLTLTSKEKLEKEINEKNKIEKTLIVSEKKLKLAQTIAAVGSWEINLKEQTMSASEETFNILEIEQTKDVIRLDEIRKIVDLADKDKLDNAFLNLINDDLPCDVTFKIKVGNNKIKYLNAKATIEGDRNKISGIFHDITNLMLAEKKLKLEKDKFEMYLDIVGVIILVLDPLGTVVHINKKGCKILGYPEEEIIGKNWLANFLPKSDQKEITEVFNEILENPTQFETTNQNYILTADKQKRLISWNNILLYDIDQNITGILCSGEDITEAEIYKQQLYNLGYEDSLTNLKNRRYYEETLIKLDVEENYPLTIVMADINGLKLVNDAFGHQSGDELLIACAKILKNSCGEENLIARIGGDEFVMVLPNTNENKVEAIISKIEEEAAQIKIESIPLSISFGYKTKHHSNENVQSTYRSAEDSMYRKKLIEIHSMRSGAIETILQTLYEKSENAEIHSRRVSKISQKLAKYYGLKMEDVTEAKMAGLLHDIGKIVIPLGILNKDGKLTTEEYQIIKTHPEIGFRILNSTSNMREIAKIVLSHHERWDGGGYPQGLKKNEIPLQARIIAIADAFDAMTSERTYRKVVSYEAALQEIINNAGTQFDPELVKVFEQHFTKITA